MSSSKCGFAGIIARSDWAVGDVLSLSYKLGTRRIDRDWIRVGRV